MRVQASSRPPSFPLGPLPAGGGCKTPLPPRRYFICRRGSLVACARAIYAIVYIMIVSRMRAPERPLKNSIKSTTT